MAASKVRRRTRTRGSIDVLPSGALRVRVYAGQDPLTKKRHVLVETIPTGPRAQKLAEAALDRMQREVADRRTPRTDATVGHLLERYLGQFAGSENTLQLYRGHVRNHISPLLGRLKVGELTPETLDSFYAELRRCRAHCKRKRGAVDHRVTVDHDCDERCRPHECRPLAPTTIRHIHFIMSGAYKRAVAGDG
jgi:integrase